MEKPKVRYGIEEGKKKKVLCRCNTGKFLIDRQDTTDKIPLDARKFRYFMDDKRFNDRCPECTAYFYYLHKKDGLDFPPKEAENEPR